MASNTCLRQHQKSHVLGRCEPLALLAGRHLDEVLENLNRMVDRGAYGPGRTVHMLQRGGDTLQERHGPFRRQDLVPAGHLPNLGDSLLDTFDSWLRLPPKSVAAEACLELQSMRIRLNRAVGVSIARERAR